MVNEFDVKQAEKVAALEVETDTLKTRVDSHESMIVDIKDKMSLLVTEVKQIRNALYFMGAAVAANVPALSDLLHKIKFFFVG